MIELPKKEIFIALKNQQYLHLVFPKDYTTSQEICDKFTSGGLLFTVPRGESVENYTKYLTIYQSRYPIDVSFMINDTAFNLSGQTMIDSRTKTLDENFFFKYMETLNTKGEVFLEVAMYLNTLDNNCSFICAYVEKLDKILNEEEFLDKIGHMNNIIPYEFEFLDT